MSKKIYTTPDEKAYKLYLHHQPETNKLFLITDWKLYFRSHIRSLRQKQHLHEAVVLDQMAQFKTSNKQHYREEIRNKQKQYFKKLKDDQ